MKVSHGNDFEERRSASLDAKKAMVEKFRFAATRDTAAAQVRAAERRAIAENRLARAAERKNANLAKLAREQQEAVERAEAELATEAERQQPLQPSRLHELKRNSVSRHVSLPTKPRARRHATPSTPPARHVRTKSDLKIDSTRAAYTAHEHAIVFLRDVGLGAYRRSISSVAQLVSWNAHERDGMPSRGRWSFPVRRSGSASRQRSGRQG